MGSCSVPYVIIVATVVIVVAFFFPSCCASVVLVEALVETALESGLIVGFVGAVEYLLVRYLPGTKVEKFSEVARLALWTAAVFGSGSATAGPKRWLEKSQLFNIDVPIGKDWWVKMSLSCALSLFLVDVVDRPHGYLFFIPLFYIFLFLCVFVARILFFVDVFAFPLFRFSRFSFFFAMHS